MDRVSPTVNRTARSLARSFVCVCACVPKHIAHDQERHVARARGLEYLVGALLDKIAISFNHRTAIESFESLSIDTKDTRVRLEEHLVAALDRLESLDRDIALVAETQSDQIQHPLSVQPGRERDTRDRCLALIVDTWHAKQTNESIAACLCSEKDESDERPGGLESLLDELSRVVVVRET